MIKQLGSGKPVLLLHSSMSSHRQWQALVSELSAGRQCYLPDLTGYGGRELPEQQPWSFAAEAQALLQKLPAKLHHDPVDLVGHSYGGALALHLARCQQLKINKLVLFEPVSFHLLPQMADAGALWQEVRALADALPGLPEEAAAQRFIDYWQQDGFFAALPARMQQQLASQVAKVTLDFQALSQEPASLADYASAIPGKVLLLTGRRSRAPAQRIARALAEALPQAELVTLDCGHMGPVTEPQLVNPLILQFLQG
ncbi:MAG: alpha/beta fold hydrolase [Rheinheimera sp.]|nr:MAG: alpha/beta fold hydrolase [Rheinheimera sp.]